MPALPPSRNGVPPDVKKALLVFALVAGGLMAVPVLAKLLINEGLRRPAQRGAPAMVVVGARLSMLVREHQQAGKAWECASYYFPGRIDLAMAQYRAAQCHEREGNTAEALRGYQAFTQRWPSHRWASRADRRITALQVGRFRPHSAGSRRRP